MVMLYANTIPYYFGVLSFGIQGGETLKLTFLPYHKISSLTAYIHQQALNYLCILKGLNIIYIYVNCCYAMLFRG